MYSSVHDKFGLRKIFGDEITNRVLIYFRLFLGLSAEAINREVASTIECADMARLRKVQPLGQPREAIIKLASLITMKNETRRKRMLSNNDQDERKPLRTRI